MTPHPRKRRRYCAHPIHAERLEGRAGLRSYKPATVHFCDACFLHGRVEGLAYGKEV